MGTYRVMERSYINDRIVEEGDIVELDDKMEIGPNFKKEKPGTKVTAPNPADDFNVRKE